MRELIGYEFVSEPGITIFGTEFKIRRIEYTDKDDGQVKHYEQAIGREYGSGAWFFVPPKERTRLESFFGVIFHYE